MAVVIRLIAQYAPWLYALCGLGVLLYFRGVLVARRERKQALFTLEREAASSRETRNMVGMFVFLGLAGSVFFVKAALEPRLPQPVEESDEIAVKTVFLITPTSPLPTDTPPPSPTPEPSPTPTRRVIPTLAPSPTPSLAPPPPCSEIARITSPGLGAVLTGRVEIHGTAAAPNFWFYKVEYQREGEPEGSWHSISDVHRNPVTNGLLEVWDTGPFPPGRYRLKLTVVDITGNYPPQNICEVPVGISH